MSYCEEKNRLIRAHAEAVDRYVGLVARRHDGFDMLTDGERHSLVADIKIIRKTIDAQRDALDGHTAQHGCRTSPAPDDLSFLH